MFYRKLFRYALSRIEYGELAVEETFAGGKNYVLKGRHTGYQASLTVRDPYFYKHVVLYGEIGFGEAYVENTWDAKDLNETLRWFAQNNRFLPGFSGASVATWGVNLLGLVNRIRHALRPNTQKISRRNIAEHYDLGNDFYELMLGKTMAYSCGIYRHPRESLDAAQERKFETLCQKLQLNERDHLLEIGSGWGGFAIYAAKKYACRVTTVTISREQYEYARAKIRAARLEDKIELRLQDYRELSGQFDKIVSIEMVEAVGYRYFNTFFGKCAALLAPDGLLVLQYITFPEPRYEQYLRNTDFTQIYIFPGSCLMSNYEVMRSLHRTGDLLLTDVETIGQHYATTLRHWRHNIEKHREKIRGMDYGEKFLRKWVYYLCFCEAGFAERAINDVHVVFSRAGTKKHGDFHGVGAPYLDRL